MDKSRHVAMVLAAGTGSRMHRNMPKQFLHIAGEPMIYYSLKIMEESFPDEVVLVVLDEWREYCREEIVKKYGFKKVRAIVGGGERRCDSVYRGLCEIKNADYVYIHDAARPFVSRNIMEAARECAESCGACVAGMPAKDTMKIADESGIAQETPRRDRVWQIQTPQAFSYELIKKAYDAFYADGEPFEATDDAMIVERLTEHPVQLFAASYGNMKITTAEDMEIAEILMSRRLRGE